MPPLPTSSLSLSSFFSAALVPKRDEPDAAFPNKEVVPLFPKREPETLVAGFPKRPVVGAVEEPKRPVVGAVEAPKRPYPLPISFGLWSPHSEFELANRPPVVSLLVPKRPVVTGLPKSDVSGALKAAEFPNKEVVGFASSYPKTTSCFFCGMVALLKHDERVKPPF